MIEFDNLYMALIQFIGFKNNKMKSFFPILGFKPKFKSQYR